MIEHFIVSLSCTSFTLYYALYALYDHIGILNLFPTQTVYKMYSSLVTSCIYGQKLRVDMAVSFVDRVDGCISVDRVDSCIFC